MKLFGQKIVHACTSTTMPVTGSRLQHLASAFMNEDPIEVRLISLQLPYCLQHDCCKALPHMLGQSQCSA